MRVSGWRITGYVFVALVLVAAAVLTVEGFNEASIRILVRATARVAVALFLLAFTASSLHNLFQTNWSAGLLRNRRYIGVSFALAHGCHLLTLVALGVWFPYPFREKLNAVTLIGGGLAYAFIAAMAATSSDAAIRWLGARRWKLLHTIGAYYIWILFAQAYAPRAMHSAAYVPAAVAVFGALALRFAATMKRRFSRPASRAIANKASCGLLSEPAGPHRDRIGS